MPNPDVIDLKLKLWKRKRSEVEKKDHPASLSKATKHCDKLKFPNVFTLKKDWLHLASYLSRVQTELFCHEKTENMVKIYDMKSDSLRSLAIMNIHRNVEVDYKEAAKLFFTLYHRKIQESSLTLAEISPLPKKFRCFSFGFQLTFGFKL